MIRAHGRYVFWRNPARAKATPANTAAVTEAAPPLHRKTTSQRPPKPPLRADGLFSCPISVDSTCEKTQNPCEKMLNLCEKMLNPCEKSRKTLREALIPLREVTEPLRENTEPLPVTSSPRTYHRRRCSKTGSAGGGNTESFVFSDDCKAKRDSRGFGTKL